MECTADVRRASTSWGRYARPSPLPLIRARSSLLEPPVSCIHSTAMTTPQETPLTSLLGLLTTSIHTIEAELKAAPMPPFTLEPRWHPLDSPDAIPSPRLHEARRVAMASANMIRALVQDVGTALMVILVPSLMLGTPHLSEKKRY